MFLGERSSRGFVTNGLLRIYNDSMENALSCWLTEHNCPYTLQKYKPSVLSVGKADREWGTSWGNRMYNRVIQLDRAYNSLRIRTLTAEEERTVSKALKMTVVAFASQWAQAGERGTGFPSPDFSFTTDEFPESNYFERSMQESLWHQTSQILHRAAGIDSFRVVFAMIIFSLTQRPLDLSRPAPHPTSKLKSQYEYFKNLIQDDDAPIFLEIALRQMMAQRRTLERAEHEMPRLPNGEPQDPLRPEDRDTFNLLYWLGVMFDTLSAAICQRTVVVNDEDCELPRSESQRLTQSSAWPMVPTAYDEHLLGINTIPQIPNMSDSRAPRDHKVWGDLFMRDIELQADPQATRWPCSYKLAASTLSSAAPVKVLLYRRVAQIQTLVSRRAEASKIEASINAAFHVYNHWNRNYNPFITDCVKHHATLPTRVQSWYILLAGHWHLGVFLLSDLLSTIDETRLSLPNERACRQVSDLVTTLRKQNAYAVADLALASIHSAQGEVAEEFHFALNQAALLTEPWTIVFVRSLCRAGHILVQTTAADSSEQERSHAATRCADCIEGLWYLGRKSDMAFLAARCLSSMLDEARREAAALTTATATTNTAATTAIPTPEDEASDDIPTAASYHLDDESTPRDVAEPLDFPQQPPGTTAANSNPAIDCSTFFQPWSVADIMGGTSTGCQITAAAAAAAAAVSTDQMPPLTECNILDFQTPLGMDPSLWDFGLQS
ncbi:uncharacterized protein SETTUDRAFT_140552 [Exserohilum turcica Et28A]|uniref:C6 transcription factor n=1 Tax=Exserohilum turcicum (strain 28A) TaxID=671987 RepID=R0IAI4_EXST2|nr:uncharacterized protein SETTUDRAFT_140552 [Exserohilum turcica Et28A]EOA82460.1 hypothetical protein SETTUDRAFT_140552 [Exserohilum turcica Et28A]